jgi:hypothetical protein
MYFLQSYSGLTLPDDDRFEFNLEQLESYVRVGLGLRQFKERPRDA